MVPYSTHWLLTSNNDCLQHTLTVYNTDWLLTAHCLFTAHTHSLQNTECLQHTLSAYSKHWLLTAYTDCLQLTLIPYRTLSAYRTDNDCLQNTVNVYSKHWLLTAHSDCLQQHTLIAYSTHWLLTTHTECLQYTVIHCKKVLQTDKLIRCLEQFKISLNLRNNSEIFQVKIKLIRTFAWLKNAMCYNDISDVIS